MLKARCRKISAKLLHLLSYLLQELLIIRIGNDLLYEITDEKHLFFLETPGG